MVEFEQSKKPERKFEAFEKIKKLKNKDVANFFDLTVDQFKLISEWYGLAILECVSTYGKSFSEKELSRHFAITLTEVSLTLERLQRLELIFKNDLGVWERVQGRLIVNSATPNQTIRNYYKSVSLKSIETYETQTPQEKVSATEVFAFDPSQIDEVRKITDEYLDKLIALSKEGQGRTQTYQALLNIFRISNQEKSL